MRKRRKSRTRAISQASYAASASAKMLPRATRWRTLLTQQRKGMLRMSWAEVRMRSRTTEALLEEAGSRAEARRVSGVVGVGVGASLSTARSTRREEDKDARREGVGFGGRREGEWRRDGGFEG
eukprot:1154791-Rhodomonas_salina.1